MGRYIRNKLLLVVVVVAVVVSVLFQLHRYVMFVVAGLTTAAIVTIFVSVGRWSEVSGDDYLLPLHVQMPLVVVPMYKHFKV